MPVTPVPTGLMMVAAPRPRMHTGLPPLVPAVVCAGTARAFGVVDTVGLTKKVPLARSTSPPLAG